jgi:hypothetical protein
MYLAKSSAGLHKRDVGILLRGDMPRPELLRHRPTIARRYGNPTEITIGVEGLAWATAASIRSVLRSDHRRAAEDVACRLLRRP